MLTYHHTHAQEKVSVVQIKPIGQFNIPDDLQLVYWLSCLVTMYKSQV